MTMECMGSMRNLSEEIELCGKLRIDIGNALKANVHKAAKYGVFLIGAVTFSCHAFHQNAD